MNNKEKTEEFINCAALKNVNFFAFRDREGFHNYGASIYTRRNLDTQCFVISDFKGIKRVSIPVELQNVESLRCLPPRINLEDLPNETSRKTYYNNVCKAITSIKNKGEAKIVISKIKAAETSKSVGSIYSALSEKYPEAFVFCFALSDSDIWIGATPELLLKNSDNILETMALAGTRVVNSKENWSQKEIQEQAFVKKYILDIFEKSRIYPSEGVTFTKKAGPVEHICTPIYASSREMSTFDISNILNLLSPTPALGGFPADWAIKKITDIESHERSFYGGYIGWIDNLNNWSFYVNLRSMILRNSLVRLFVGGGITVDSNPEKEWEETESKAETLLKIL